MGRAVWNPRSWKAGVVVAFSAMLLAGSFSPARGDSPSPSTACFWHLKLNGKHGVNAGWPDNEATYWYAHYTTVPGGRIVLRGSYPASRFFVIDAYDSKANPYVPELRDGRIEADPGSQNPFLTPSANGANHYTAYIDFGTAPPVPAPNTDYVGMTRDGQPNPAGLLTLRVYLPNDPASDSGSVPLPEATLELPGGIALPMRACPTPDDVAVQPAVSQTI